MEESPQPKSKGDACEERRSGVCGRRLGLITNHQSRRLRLPADTPLVGQAAAD